jgi:hypothetical protein
MAVTASDLLFRQILKMAEELETLELIMQGVLASLPESPAESFKLADVEIMDLTAEVRAAIACIRNDHVSPAARGLREVLRKAGPDPASGA